MATSRPDIPSTIVCTTSVVQRLESLSMTNPPRGVPTTRSNRTLQWYAAQMGHARKCGVSLPFEWDDVLAKYSPEPVATIPDVETMLFPYVPTDQDARWVSEVEVTADELIRRWPAHLLKAYGLIDANDTSLADALTVAQWLLRQRLERKRQSLTDTAVGYFRNKWESARRSRIEGGE